MKFVKKNIKLIIGMILGTLLVSGISVYATYNYLATDVIYTRDGVEKNVGEALNELYNRQKETSDKKYTETEYQNYGKSQYDKAMTEHNYYVNDSFTIKTGTNYYELGFTPSVIFLDCGGDLYAWTSNGENTKHWANGMGQSGIDSDGTKIEGTGFYWTSKEDVVVKIYVVK